MTASHGLIYVKCTFPCHENKDIQVTEVIGRSTKGSSRRQRHLPDGDVVIDGLGAQHGEVDVDAVAGRNSDAPHAVLEVGVLLRVAGGVNGSVQGGDVAAAQGCQTRSTARANNPREISGIDEATL